MRKHTDLWERLTQMENIEQAVLLRFMFAYCESNPKITFIKALRRGLKYHGKKPETLTTE